jgi:hypothetical protein
VARSIEPRARHAVEQSPEEAWSCCSAALRSAPAARKTASPAPPPLPPTAVAGEGAGMMGAREAGAPGAGGGGGAPSRDLAADAGASAAGSETTGEAAGCTELAPHACIIQEALTTPTRTTRDRFVTCVLRLSSLGAPPPRRWHRPWRAREPLPGRRPLASRAPAPCSSLARRAHPAPRRRGSTRALRR